MISTAPSRREAESVTPDTPLARPDRAARWQLTPESFRALLSALDPHESRAVERYQRLHQRLVLFFMRHRAVHPEDLADIAINRLARKLADGEPIENLEAFTLGIARLVQREDQTGNLRNQRAISEWMRNETSSSSTSNQDEEKLDIMEKHFAALPLSARELLASYHLGRGIARIERRQRLARDLGVSIGTLRKRVFDLQTQLRIRLEKGSAKGSALYPAQEPEHR